jgi:hypothetical protein
MKGPTANAVNLIVPADAADFTSFFHDATGFTPHEWQVLVATGGPPEGLPIILTRSCPVAGFLNVDVI